MAIDEQILKLLDLQDENLERADKKKKLERKLTIVNRDSSEQPLVTEQLENEINAQEILMTNNQGIINTIQHEIETYLKENNLESYTFKQHESEYTIHLQDDDLKFSGRY